MKELLPFKPSINPETRHESYGGVGQHDDLVMAFALATLWAFRPNHQDGGLYTSRSYSTGDSLAEGQQGQQVSRFRPEWRNGRRSGLKIHRGQPRASSTLASGTPLQLTTSGLQVHSTYEVRFVGFVCRLFAMEVHRGC